jgi:hypothetical protein
MRCCACYGVWGKKQSKKIELKISYFFRGRGKAEVKSGAYMSICEHFYFRPDKESGKKRF